MEITDALNIEIETVMNMVRAELRDAIRRYPPFNSAHEGDGVISEEYDELFDAIKANELAQSTDEAVQVAAMAIRYVIDSNDFRKS